MRCLQDVTHRRACPTACGAALWMGVGVGLPLYDVVCGVAWRSGGVQRQGWVWVSPGINVRCVAVVCAAACGTAAGVGSGCSAGCRQEKPDMGAGKQGTVRRQGRAGQRKQVTVVGSAAGISAVGVTLLVYLAERRKLAVPVAPGHTQGQTLRAHACRMHACLQGSMARDRGQGGYHATQAGRPTLARWSLRDEPRPRAGEAPNQAFTRVVTRRFPVQYIQVHLASPPGGWLPERRHAHFKVPCFFSPADCSGRLSPEEPLVQPSRDSL